MCCVSAADDLLALLERGKAGLKPGGLFIIKENICEQGFIVDPVWSITLPSYNNLRTWPSNIHLLALGQLIPDPVPKLCC